MCMCSYINDFVQFSLKERADACWIDINYWKDWSIVDVEYEVEENG